MKCMITHFHHQFVLGLKKALYGSRGEPYRIKGHTLRYMPGTDALCAVPEQHCALRCFAGSAAHNPLEGG
jgi:hypothetical protein